MHAPKISYHLMLLLVATGIAFATGSTARAVGNAQRGKAIAREQCSNCHVVSKNDAKALEGQMIGPDFAAMKNVTALNLTGRLNSPHPVMSKFPSLTDQQIADLVAYIGSVNK